MMKYRIGAGLLSLAALTALVYVASAGEGGGVNADVRKIAAALKKGDAAGAEKLAKAAAKKVEEVGDVMHAFKLRSKKGLGVGDQSIAKNDGIEAKLREVGRDAPAGLAKDAAGLEHLGYDTAAIALITESLAPAKDQGKKTRKDWLQWSQDMKESGIALATAAKAQGANDVKTSAVKINNSCNSCHSVWR